MLGERRPLDPLQRQPQCYAFGYEGRVLDRGARAEQRVGRRLGHRGPVFGTGCVHRGLRQTLLRAPTGNDRQVGRGWSPAAMTAQDILDALNDTRGSSPEAKLRLALAPIKEEEPAEEFAAFPVEPA